MEKQFPQFLEFTIQSSVLIDFGMRCGKSVFSLFTFCSMCWKARQLHDIYTYTHTHSFDYVITGVNLKLISCIRGVSFSVLLSGFEILCAICIGLLFSIFQLHIDQSRVLNLVHRAFHSILTKDYLFFSILLVHSFDLCSCVFFVFFFFFSILMNLFPPVKASESVPSCCCCCCCQSQ